MSRTIDINADMGEAWSVYPAPQQVWRAEWEQTGGPLGPQEPLGGPDIQRVLKHASSVNLACGMHAGDPLSIRQYVQWCVDAGISIGAHPSYPDPLGFGNRSMVVPFRELVAVIQYQLAALQGITRMLGGRLNHVKLHGALYHDAHVKQEVAEAVTEAVREFDPELYVYGLPDGKLHAATQAAGLRYIREGFPDRTYLSDGNLKPRSFPDALITTPTEVAQRGLNIADNGVTADDGSIVELQVDTLCIHPDTPGAPQGIESLRALLEAHDFKIHAPGQVT